ncbi:hypothetical protein HB662_13555 [Roseomonas frigidaquae]|uniref:Uncharacterized protein n=1 Tax=Falsiroseomonas frigidaquae TaxID=487318 RepID=A0ABX1F0E3_9PROT|nr:hypothetical protein [Falsiroseomonas frigidaquae]NKE45812.1 hypothetical protein [Falsiroseomonas frigidaquae]
MAAAPGNEAAPSRLDRLCNAPVWWSIVALLAVVLALPWSQDRLAERGWPPDTFLWRYLAVAAIGAVVGFAELVSRYRDEPWIVAASPPGLTFIGANAAAALAALGVLEYYPEVFAPPADGLTRTLLAGFGAMLVLRSKLLTLRQPGGTDVEVGPAFVVDSLLTAVNRDVDRRRAERRIGLVTRMARRFSAHPFEQSAPHLKGALLAFQTMDAEERTRLSNTIRTMLSDPEIVALSNEVKYAMIGYDYLTAFGEQTFICAFDELERSILATPASPPAPGG